ncbi:MAG TPA: hypothetical protein VEW27_14575 [Methylomirabilota bacterium]|nr:hypothetical protein [Methylomirabilota bacterium]
MATVRQISEKKLEANRRNARQSTGPRTDAGKLASRQNAVTHGLLAKAVVITAGDYQEDPEEFAQLLDDLREQFLPVGVAEDLEVQEITRYYWRKMRAVRYEHGAIRKRTGDLREREARRCESRFDVSLSLGSDLERSSRGIQYLIDYLENVKQEVHDGTVSGESYKWLEQHFPDEFAPPDETQLLDEETAASPAASKDCGRQMVAKINEQLRRLSPLREKLATIEELNLESKLSAAALPGPEAVDRLIRYETSNDRALDRALKRLEVMQARRRKQGDAPPEK